MTIIKNVSGDIPLLLQELKHALGSLPMHIDTDRQTDRQTDKQTETQTDRWASFPLAGSGGSYDANTQQLEVQGDHTVRAPLRKGSQVEFGLER